MSTREILLVDDDRLDALTVQRALKEYAPDWEVEVRYTADAALEYLQEVRASDERCNLLVLLDLSMPSMNGFEFLERLKEDEVEPFCTVFVHTSSNRPDDRARAWGYDIAGYFLKEDTSLHPERLGAVVDTYLRLNQYAPQQLPH